MWKYSVYSVLFVCMACSKAEDVENIYNVPVEFKVDLSQVISENGAIPAFKISTLEKIGCENHSLKTEYSRSSNNAFIRVLGIDQQNSCLTSDHYLSTEVSDEYDQGVYNFMVQIKDEIQNKGTFSVRENEYILSMYDAPNITIGTTNVHKLPADTWWGAIYFTSEVQSQAASEFYEILANYSKPHNDFKIGEYGLFRVNSNKSVILSRFASYPGYSGFFVQKLKDEEELKKELISFLKRYPETKLFISSHTSIVLEK